MVESRLNLCHEKKQISFIMFTVIVKGSIIIKNLHNA